jgi:hypothetical protein
VGSAIVIDEPASTARKLSECTRFDTDNVGIVESGPTLSVLGWAFSDRTTPT